MLRVQRKEIGFSNATWEKNSDAKCCAKSDALRFWSTQGRAPPRHTDRDELASNLAPLLARASHSAQLGRSLRLRRRLSELRGQRIQPLKD
jgi:hypothetical protein